MDLHATPANPVPEGAVCGLIETEDGVKLRFARWRPTAPLRGTVAVFPGRAESIEKYFEVVRELRARGFAVAVLDWRGQGGSQRLLRNPRKGHVASFSHYQRDLLAFARQVLLPDCPAPHFALAHSMAGAIMLRSVVDGHRWFDRMVLCGPMLGLDLVPMQPLVRPLAGTLSRLGFGRAYVPGGGPLPPGERPFKDNILTSDPARHRRNADITRAHPGLAVGAPTLGWLHAAYEAMAELAQPDIIPTIRQPLLMVAAGADQIVSYGAIEHLASRLVAGAHVVVPAARHELFMERDIFRAQVWAAFDAFVPGSPLP